jgi:TRAP-type C4-dicarboxylate transport system substrate-binding protein
LETEIRTLSESNKKFYQQASRFHKIVSEHSTLSDQKANKHKIAQELKEDMEEITGGKLFLQNYCVCALTMVFLVPPSSNVVPVA